MRYIKMIPWLPSGKNVDNSPTQRQWKTREKYWRAMAGKMKWDAGENRIIKNFGRKKMSILEKMKKRLPKQEAEKQKTS